MFLQVLIICTLAIYGNSVPTPYGYIPTVRVAPAYPPPATKIVAAYAPPIEKPRPYEFGYDFKDEEGNSQWRNEAGDEYGAKKGSYGYIDALGIRRHVDYEAGPDGFRAWIKTNEPGTQTSNPADVQIVSEPAPVKQAVVVPKIYKAPVIKEAITYKPVKYTYGLPYVPPKVVYGQVPGKLIYQNPVPFVKPYYMY